MPGGPMPGGPMPGGAAPNPGSGPNLLVGVALLVCSAACLGLLFFPPTRLLALLLVLPVGASVLYVWFRERARTNAALTVGALAILSITVGLGVAMMISERQGSAPTPHAPLTPTSGDPVLSSPAPVPASPTAVSPSKAAPTPAPAPAPTVAKHPAATASRPTTRDHGAPRASRSPEPSRTGHDSDSDSDRHSSDRNRDRDSDRDSDLPSDEPERPKSCSFGDVRINPDGTGDVCADSNGDGGYGWRRNQRIPD